MDQLQITSDSAKSADGPSGKSKTQAQKQLVEELKVQWKLLWEERFDDKVRAEGISVNDYERLFVTQGTVIHATKDFKALNFKDILEQHKVENPERYIPPNISVGGWNKFIKTEVTGQRIKKANSPPVKSSCQMQKKNKRGWLHTA